MSDTAKAPGRGKRTVQLLQQFSIPLIAGVFVALALANISWPIYHHLVHVPVYELFTTPVDYEGHSAHADEHDGEHGAGEGHEDGDHDGDDHKADDHKDGEHADGDAAHKDGDDADHGDAHGGHGHGWGHYFTLHFLVNDIFMVLFFGIAAKEITESCLPGGALNPVKKAVNPLMGTIGGILGPVGVYLVLNLAMGDPAWAKGWGIPTATDIALAWLVARFVFGQGHPAISFLLLLAVADDAIGLGIIAFAYGDPENPTEWINTLWILPGMLAAFALRKFNVQNWVPYIVIGGVFSWWGLYSAHLHPALALVFIVPFLPGPKRDLGLYEESDDHDEKEAAHPHDHGHSPLEQFEHQLKFPVDFGLFFFSFANAGVLLSGVNNLTWIVLLALLAGKTIGITALSYGGQMIGFPLPKGMTLRHLVVAAVIAGLGLTVALFVSTQAFTQPDLQGAAKMGALLSGAAGLLAFVLGKVLGVHLNAGGPAAEEKKPADAAE